MDYIETKAKLDYLELKNKRCQALAEFTKSLSKSQFIKYQKILKLEEKIRKKEISEIINTFLKNKKH